MTEDKQPIDFNPYHSALEPGINLIEASAGTGKTFSIVMLVLRFLLQRGYRIEQLLVVTFTNAAAQELRDRIRFRLLEVKAILSGKPSADVHLNDWVASLPEQQTRLRLITVLADIDNAPIFTIHGFCQRMLNQYALESGQVFGSELLQNTSFIKQQIAEDYWRIQTYSRPVQQVVFLRSISTTPYGLMQNINGIREGSQVIPPVDNLDSCLDTLEKAIPEIKSAIGISMATLEALLADQPDKFKPKFVDYFPQLKQTLLHWHDTNETSLLPLQEILSLSTQSLASDALNGNKFRKTKVHSGEQRKAEFLQDSKILSKEVNALEAQLEILKISFQKGLYQYTQKEIKKRLGESNQLSFDSIITRFAEALNSDADIANNATHLQQLLQKQFPVALIDEFQDTDKAQWSIFSKLVEPSASNEPSASKDTSASNKPSTNKKPLACDETHDPVSKSNYLYLIGDPKQAIYKFRGADIYSYLSAQQQAHRHYNLATNWRSQESLVKAVNTLFTVNNPFLIEHIDYYPVKAALTETLLTKAGQSYEQMVLWELDKNPDQKDGYWLTNKGRPKEQIRQHVVKEILSLLTGKPNESPSTSDTGAATKPKLDTNPVTPSDIAILVRSNPEAAAYQQALMKYGVPAVLNSKTSVFASEQALQIYHILRAISRPTSQSLMRYALCQSWFGLTGNDLYALQEHQQQMDNWLISFHHYHELWEQKGLLAMMHKLMEDKEVVVHLSQSIEAERSLTNINHILEMLQEVALTKRLSMLKTLEWLEDAIQEKTTQDGQELRLESDKDAVNIVTIHSAKGMEYPIVFCPDLWTKSRTSRSNIAVFHQNGEQVSDLGSKQIDQHRKKMADEEQAEGLRLLYVALTRAKYRCYIAWVNQRSIAQENTSALAYLLRQQTGENWTARLTHLVETGQDAFSYQHLEVNTEIDNDYNGNEEEIALINNKINRPIKVDWKMSSYSALAYYSVHDDSPELPLDKAQEQVDLQPTDHIDDGTAALPKGAHTGNLVHELLELTPFNVLSQPLSDNAEYLENRRVMISRFGVDIEDTRLLDQLLGNTVKTSLSDHDEGFKLASLKDEQCVKEMPFYLAVDKLETKKINKVLMNSPGYLPLSEQHMRGQLTGFIDLICEYQGKYYVMDYKTNSLDEYNEQSMTQAMREHNYGLQYWIYSLVLHRYLQQTLDNYSFDQHFGGVRYLFVRGMNPQIPMSGVFQSLPDNNVLDALSEVFQ